MFAFRTTTLGVSLFIAAAVAQTTSQQIAGTVKDPTGAFITTANVTVRQTGTGFERQGAVSESGYFVVTNLGIGEYDVTVEAAGFQRYVQRSVKVGVNDRISLDIVMRIGSVTDSVTVTADAAQVDTTSGEVGRVVSGEQATQLQLNGRNYTQLLALLPGISTNVRSNFDLASGFGAAVNNQSVNGGRTGTLSVYLDGSDNLATRGGGHSFVNINPDALAEVKVLTSNYSAEYGQSAGAVMNIALRSGARDFHGSLYEFVRNYAFDARAFNTLRKQKLTFNNFGWNFGGPVFIPGKFNRNRDKLFFFAGMDMKRLRRGNPTVWNVPTAAESAGNFSAPPAAQWPRDPATGQTFPGGIIPSSRMFPNGQRLVQNFPMPNFPGPGGNYAFEFTYPMNVTQSIVKLDYNLNDKHQFSWHRVHDDYNSVENLTTLITYGRTIPGTNQSWKWTYVVNPTTVHTFQFSLPVHDIFQRDFQPNPLFVSDYSRQGQGIKLPHALWPQQRDSFGLSGGL
ncbi:MAG: carboxypeptidase regulatory-like domain-containing protein [Bryobacteraceae bacterium]